MSFSRPITLAILGVAQLAFASVQAQTPSVQIFQPAQALQSLHAAVEAAWQKQPSQRAHGARLAEADAKRRANQALTPEPAAIALGRRSDQLSSNVGRRETEIELSAPLWLPGQRNAQRALLDAESSAYASTQLFAKWRLAGEVREAWWQARLSSAERELAAQQVAAAAALAGDVARRVRAGDLAQVDANRANAEQQTAQIALGEAELRTLRSVQQLTLLTGSASLPDGAEAPATAQAALHPQSMAAQRLVTLAGQRAAYASVTARDAPELSLAVTRERNAIGERYDNSLMLRLKVPFATDARNQPRLRAAQAELAEAEANQEADAARVDADIAAARQALAQAQTTVLLATSRAALSRETQRLLERAFTLGEIDLPARLRADSERFDAERNVMRAQLESEHAISTLNQALGVLP